MLKRIKGLKFSGISDDSRNVKKGDIFFAVEGAQFDGRKFIDEAINRGAVAVVRGKERRTKDEGRRTRDEGIKVISVENPRVALAQCASEFYGRPSKEIKVIGITGTNGKTTVSYLLESIFKKAGLQAGIIGTIAHRWNGRLIEAKNTTPGSLELQRLLSDMGGDGVRYCAMEVSSHSLDQDRTFGIDFSAAIFTNITGEHLDYHKTFENYLKAKIKLFKSLKSNRLAVLNLDDENFEKIRRNASRARVLTYGMGLRLKKADITANEIKFSLAKTEFLVRTKKWGSFKVITPLMGIFNVYNILAAIAAALDERISTETIKEAISVFKGAEGRLEAVEADSNFKIFIDYAHTDDALENVLKTLRCLVKNRLIVVFGCGGDRDRFKRPRMGNVASKLADYVIITSDNPRSEEPSEIARQIQKGIEKDFKSYEIILDRHEAIKNAMDIARAGDIVLIAGKGHEKYQIMKDKILPFSDRETVLKILPRNPKGPVRDYVDHK